MLALTACSSKKTPSSADNSNGASNPQAAEKLVVSDGSKLGVLQSVGELQDFIINGLYISTESRQHDYMHVDDVEKFEIDKLNSEFELNEWIGFYVDTQSTAQELQAICSQQDYPTILDAIPDSENHRFIGQAYVNPESSQPDLFNVFFVSNGNVYYMVQLNLISENTTK